MTQENEGQENQGQPPKRNVFLARNAKPVTVEGVVNIGGHGQIELPDEAAQRTGFYLEPEDLTLLLNQYPGIYKPAFVYVKGQTAISTEYLASVAEAQKVGDAGDDEAQGDEKQGDGKQEGQQ